LKLVAIGPFENTYSAISKLLSDADFIARHRQHTQDFTRERTLTFRRLVMLLINQLKGSLQDELDRFFRVHSPSRLFQRVVTNAALSKARKKLKASAFIELNEKSLETFYEEFPLQNRWHGFRLLAVDGSKVELPSDPEVEEQFGLHETSGRPMGLLSTLYDLNNRLWLHAELVPTSIGERASVREHLKKTNQDDLLVYDRGYPAFWFFSLHKQVERNFCVRLQRGLSKEVDDFFTLGESEAIVRITASKKSRSKCQHYGVPSSPVNLRLIRVELDSGGVEVLATSLLDSKRYPTNLFADLYHRRWNHEEGYKQLKIHAELQNWSGRKLHTIFQDLHAKLLTLNLAAMQEAAAQILVDQNTQGRKHRYQVNRVQALSQMKDVIVRILDSPNPRSWLRRLAISMANNINAVRPGRKFERKPRLGAGIRVRPGYK